MSSFNFLKGIKNALILRLIVFLFFSFLAQLSIAQTLTISSTGGDTGASGAFWSSSGTNPVKIVFTGTANINKSVIETFLATDNVVIESGTGGEDVIINSNISNSSNKSLTLKVTRNIVLNSSKIISTSGGDVIFWADSDASGTATSAGGSIYLNDASTINTSGGDIVLAGGADTNTDGIPDGYAIGAVSTTTHGATNATAGLALDNASLDAGAGNLILRGHGTGDLQNFQIGTRLYGGSIKGADITIEAKGSIRGPSSSSWGLSLEGFSINGTGNIIINGWGGRAGQSNADANQVGVELRRAFDNISKHSQIKTTGSGNITINGVGGSGAFASTGVEPTGIRIEVSQTNPIVSENGTITLNGTSGYSGRGPGIMIASPISSTNGKIILKANRSVAGTLDQNGNIEIKGTITTGGEVNLESLGAVTQTEAITANKLGLIGSGTFTLTNTSNNVATIAGGDNTTKLGNVSYVDASDGLTIGTVASKNGLTSTGTISVESLSNDITISQNISTTNTTTTAIVINAGKSSAIGTTSGGNIKISGSPTITTGTGGTAKLFSGTEGGSNGLTTLVGGSSNTRTDVDETTSTFSPVLSSGVYALYRAATQIVAPQITSFTPEIAGNGETVTITGTGFTGVSVVKFGNVNAKSFVVVSDTEITAVVNTGASGSVYVQNTAGNDSEAGFAFKVVHYQFENNAFDKTDANLDATIVGTLSYGTGALGNSICFTNTNTYSGSTVPNYLKLPNDLIKGRGANFTISLRFKTNTYGGILGYQKEAVGNVSQYVPILYVRTDGKLSANLWQGSPLTVTSNNRVDDGNWHKVEFSASSGSITVYLDGVLAGTSNGTTDHLQMSFNQLGAANTAGTWDADPIEGWIGFNGCIDEFFIVDKSLTANQIQQATQLPQPTIASFTPTTAKSGETITITGTNLSGTSGIKIGGVDARSITVVSATEVKAIVGKDASSNNTVAITTAAGTVSSNGFTFSCSSNAFNFDGQNDHIIVGDVVENFGAFTQEAWVYWRGSNVDFTEIYTKDLVSAMAITNGNKLHANFGNGNNWGSGLNSATSIPLNKWTHVAVTRSTAGVVKMYINGVLDANTTTLNLSGQNSATRVIGGKLANGTLYGPFTGAIDELRVWNVERTAQQISENLGSEFIGNESGLIAYYNFNQGTAAGNNTGLTILNDLTASATYTGTLTNTALSGSTSNYVLGYWPLIITQPGTIVAACKGATSGNSISVSALGNGLTYQWYSNTTNSNTGGTLINGATNASYTFPVSTLGTYYYYVVVSNSCNAATATSEVSTVTVDNAPTIAYESNTYSFAQATPINAIVPTATNATSFSISPSLPTGMTFDANTGEIAGTPTTVSAAADYTITASSGSCSATTTLSISVTNAACNNFTASDFQTNGNATIADGIYTLTLNRGGQNGSVWNKTKLFIDRDFDISARVYLGNSNGGADGIAFVLQNQSLNAGSEGGGLGYFGISPSFAVEFDTYDNGTADPSADHIAIIANGNTAGAHNTYSAPYEVELEDGQWHAVRFVWNATSKNFQVWYKGVKRHDITVDLKNDIFAGRSYVYWGFTGATGGLSNLQQVELPEYCYTPQVGVEKLPGTNNTDASTTFCVGASVILKASNASTYQWFKDGEAITDATDAELEVSTMGTYTVEAVSAAQITTTSEPIEIVVNALPVISYASTSYSFLNGKAITAVIPTTAGASSFSILPALPAGLSFNANTGAISGTPSAAAEEKTYTVTARSSSACLATASFTLDVFNAVPPSALTFSPNSQTVRQGQAISSMTPSSSGGAVVSYTISPALPAGLSMDPTTGVISGTLTAKMSGSVTYTITAKNTGGSTTSEITLVFNTAPTDLALSPASVDENKAIGSTVGTLSTTDIDTDDTFTYEFVSGTGSTDNDRFTLSGNTIKTSEVFNFETKSSYSVRIKTTDAGGLSYEKSITISVLDVNEAPSNLASTQVAIYEANASNATIGTLSTTDQDNGDKHTYSLVSGSGSSDNASFSISGNSLRAAVSFNFKNKSSYSIRVRTTDAGGLTYEKVLIISILQSPVALGTGNVPGSKELVPPTNGNVTISKGYTSQLNVTGQGIVSYSWSPSTGLSSTTIANPIAKPSQTTTYSVTITNNLGISTVVQITVTVEEDYFITPNNVITPNGDGVNDTWFIENLETYPIHEIVIFDAAGRILYRTQSYQNDWGGLLNGTPLTEGAYYYIIRLGANKNVIKKGYISLVR